MDIGEKERVIEVIPDHEPVPPREDPMRVPDSPAELPDTVPEREKVPA